jgi:hypothetical protein
MPIRVVCPACGTYLTVSESAPMILTCPRCLAKIQRPAASVHVPPPIPIRALPLDDEVQGDANVALPVIILISILIVLGLIIMAMSAPPELKSTVSVVVGALVILAIAIGLVAIFKRSAPADTKAIDAAAFDPSSPPMLNYSSVHRQPRAVEPVRTGWFVSGFFSSLLVCAAGFLLLAASLANGSGQSMNNGNILYLLAVIISVVGLMWMATRINRRLRGFLLGATIGLCLGMLALGPCAFCYLLTLK